MHSFSSLIPWMRFSKNWELRQSLMNYSLNSSIALRAWALGMIRL